jgi:hypothetical protein
MRMARGVRWGALVSLLVGTASVDAGPAFAAASFGCRSHTTLAPWGRYPMRRWTPIRQIRQPATIDDDGSKREGLAIGAPFRARMVQAYGVDDGEARRIVEMVTAAGCYRAFRADSFVAADQAIIAAEVARHPSTPDPNRYATVLEPGQVEPGDIEAGKIAKYETQHFVFWYGTNTKGDSYAYARDTGQDWRTVLTRAGAWAEQVWHMSRDLTGAPMPYADRPAGERRRIAVYISGTGRPHVADGDLMSGTPVASPAIWITASMLNYGSKTFAHEFGHVMQFYSGGLRDSPSAGAIWEAGGNWIGNLLVPGSTTWIGSYGNRQYVGPLWPDARYGAFPFLNMLFEDPRTRPLVWAGWTRNARTAAGASTEDFVPTILRLGTASGAYPKGLRSFADDMGWYGARLVTLDFMNQRALLDAVAQSRFVFGGSRFAALVPGDRPGRFVPQSDQVLHQFGTDLIPLTPTGHRDTVSVRLTGATTAKDAAWRFALVAVRGEADASYSRLGAVEGTGSATVSYRIPKDARLYLAVTATPGVYESLGWQKPGSTEGARFPYAVDISGAAPRLKGEVDCRMPQMTLKGPPPAC